MGKSLTRKIIEGHYVSGSFGPGAASLEVPQRATIANMGAEMGATSSIFPADAQVRKFMKAQGDNVKPVSEVEKLSVRQGSSREHAAINPMYLGVKCVIAKSIARIHKGNLVNHGIIPMLFDDPAVYDSIDPMDELEINDLLDQIPARHVEVHNKTKHFTFHVSLDLTDNEIDVVLAGGQLRYLKKQLKKMEEAK